MHLDNCPSGGRIFSRPTNQGPGVTLYVEVGDLGVLVVPAESAPQDPRGRLYPVSAKLLSLAILDRLAQSQTPMLRPRREAAPRPPDDLWEP